MRLVCFLELNSLREWPMQAMLASTRAQGQEEGELVCLYALVYMDLMNERNARVCGPTFVWHEYLAEVMRHPGRFQRRYRMSLAVFNQLCTLLLPSLQKEHKNSCVNVEVVLHCTLRWLASGSYDDISSAVSISVPTFYRFIHSGMGGIISSDVLAVQFPNSIDSLKKQCTVFVALSLHGAIQGCVGVVDG